MDPGARKLMTIHKALLLRDDRDNMSRKEGRGHTRIEYSLHALIRGLEDLINKDKEKPSTTANNSSGNINIVRKNSRELRKLWIMRVTIIPIVIGALRLAGV